MVQESIFPQCSVCLIGQTVARSKRQRYTWSFMEVVMHEVSLGGMLRDYLTGEEIEETTYEEIRQALVKSLVEEKGYPKERIRPKFKLTYTVEGQEFERAIDFVVMDENDRPVFVIIFCSGYIGTYERETLGAARLIDGGPAPLALVTDTMEAQLLDVASGETLGRGMKALPAWDELRRMVAERESWELTDEQRDKETRIFHAYNGFLFGVCCSGACSVAGKK